jgi:hypothetical protein
VREFYGPCGFTPTPAGLVNLHELRRTLGLSQYEPTDPDRGALSAAGGNPR